MYSNLAPCYRGPVHLDRRGGRGGMQMPSFFLLHPKGVMGGNGGLYGFLYQGPVGSSYSSVKFNMYIFFLSWSTHINNGILYKTFPISLQTIL